MRDPKEIEKDMRRALRKVATCRAKLAEAQTDADTLATEYVQATEVKAEEYRAATK